MTDPTVVPEVQIVVSENGPYEVTGAVRVVGADGRVLRRYAAPEFNQLAGNMLDALHQQKLSTLAELLP